MGMPCHWWQNSHLHFFLTNGNDKAYHAFKHLEELEMLPKENLTMYYTNWCNSKFGSIFSKGKFQHPLTQKPFLGPVAVVNNLVIRDIMISANNEGQTFSKLMEVLMNEAPQWDQSSMDNCKCWIYHFQ
jgi:hypothetical protein